MYRFDSEAPAPVVAILIQVGRVLGDKTLVSVLVFESLECFGSAISTLNTAWNQLTWDPEGYGYQELRQVEGRMIVGLCERSRR